MPAAGRRDVRVNPITIGREEMTDEVAMTKDFRLEGHRVGDCEIRTCRHIDTGQEVYELSLQVECGGKRCSLLITRNEALDSDETPYPNHLGRPSAGPDNS